MLKGMVVFSKTPNTSAYRLVLEREKNRNILKI